MAAAVEKMSFAGEKGEPASLDLKIARPEVAKGLVHKYVVMVRQNARRGTASTLTKSEVRGGGCVQAVNPGGLEPGTSATSSSDP
jgi:large subunit ribosomal protein L4